MFRGGAALGTAPKRPSRYQSWSLLASIFILYSILSIVMTGSHRFQENSVILQQAQIVSAPQGDWRFDLKRPSNSSDLSILQGVTPSDVVMEPYPHLVLQNVLPKQVYEQLNSQFPSDEEIYRVSSGLSGPIRWLNNYRYSMQSSSLLKSRPTTRVSTLWKDFVKYHSSRAFLAEVLYVFGPALSMYRPDLLLLAHEKNVSLSELSLSTLKLSKTDLLANVEIVLNSEVKAKSSVRGPHHDKLNEIFAALLYFRRPKDNSMGGNFQVYRCKGNCTKVQNNPALKRKLGLSPLGRHEQFDPRTIDLVSEVPYR